LHDGKASGASFSMQFSNFALYASPFTANDNIGKQEET
jgi:hypothetical protein